MVAVFASLGYGYQSSSIEDISLLPDGSVIVASTLAKYRRGGFKDLFYLVDESAVGLAKLTAGGTLDGSFSGDGFVIVGGKSGFGESLAWSSVGVGGSANGFTVAAGTLLGGTVTAVRLTPNGLPDTSFTATGSIAFTSLGGTAVDGGAGKPVVRDAEHVLFSRSIISESGTTRDLQLAAVTADTPPPFTPPPPLPPPPAPPINTPPTISDVPNQTLSPGGQTSLSVTINDAETLATDLVLTVSSSNPTLTPTLIFGEGSSNRLLFLAASQDQSGTATITITVTDASGASATDIFELTVLMPPPPPNIPPNISDVADQSLTSGGQISLPIQINDTETPVGDLVLTVSSSDPALTTTLTLSGSGTTRSLALGVDGSRSGTATISLTLTDSVGATAVETFIVSVTPALIPPAPTPPPVLAPLPVPILPPVPGDLNGDRVAERIVTAAFGQEPTSQNFRREERC